MIIFIVVFIAEKEIIAVKARTIVFVNISFYS